MIGKGSQHREIRQIVEQQIRQWEAERGQTVEHAHLADDLNVEIDYIAISREVASGGREVGERLAESLKWQLYDKEILDYMAENMNVHKNVLESLDEKGVGWMRDLVGGLFKDQGVDQMHYYRHLVQVLLVIANHGNAIIIGRAAGMVLPRDRGLSVRLIAPFDVRCRRYAQRHDLSLREATLAVERIDKEQLQFVRNMLGLDVNDPSNYDIVCNTEKFSPQSAVKLIWRTLDQRQKR